MYSYIVEAPVRPDGICNGFSRHYPGSVSGIAIYHRNYAFHRVSARKKGEDEDKLKQKYPRILPIIVGQGYQGAAEILRVVHPEKTHRTTCSVWLMRSWKWKYQVISSSSRTTSDGYANCGLCYQ